MIIYLVVEDVVLATALQAKLSVFAHNVIICGGTDSDEIVNGIKVIRPDCLVLDILKRRPNGFDLLMAIKAARDDIGAPIFIYTAQDDKLTRERCLNIGADHFFSQAEFSLDQFLQKFTKIMANIKKSKLA
jgi:DNA-binding response OmpR family regulator